MDEDDQDDHGEYAHDQNDDGGYGDDRDDDEKGFGQWTITGRKSLEEELLQTI